MKQLSNPHHYGQNELVPWGFLMAARDTLGAARLRGRLRIRSADI